MYDFCKWGKSRLIYRKRIFPSGKPKEYKYSSNDDDITWDLEIKYFIKLIKRNTQTNLGKDLWIFNLLNKIEYEK